MIDMQVIMNHSMNEICFKINQEPFQMVNKKLKKKSHEAFLSTE